MADGVTTTRPVRGRSLNDNTGMDTTRHRGVAGFPRSNCRCQHRRRTSNIFHLETFSGTYTPVSSPTLVTTTAVATLPTAAASLGGPRSPTPPTARWSWSTSSEEGDDYRGVVDGVTEAVVHHVKCAMNTCCRSRVKMEIRACFARIMSEAMEPGFLDDIATQILH